MSKNIYGNTISPGHPYWDYSEEHDDDYVGLESTTKVDKDLLEIKQASLRIFDFFSTFNQLFGLSMVILVGYFYGNIDGSYYWKNIDSKSLTAEDERAYLNLHGLAVIVGLVFFHGEGILINRHFRHELKCIFKVYQIIFNIISLACGAFALASFVIYSNKQIDYQYYSFQFWLLLGVLTIYVVVSTIYMFVYTFPRLPKKFRLIIKPYTNAMTLVAFVLSSVYSILSNALYINKYLNKTNAPICNKDENCIVNLQYVMNFGLLSTVLYCIVVVIQASKKTWSRKIKNL
ncbi:Cytochrome b561, eukaryote domain and Cytochrome b561/ferric reductase transmembrane domain-containing protein [Strongyloides ratti]|uniref:Cytochrome b561, eukaryote domain and Cytochrome b561/ferric reductase transmembrane domain-containing protein n=1 Tax=Strongyloides ratti TaxID=34506 RepID=A0A090L4A8_STRRB|nr:Cytochrome b561, eukaryote domain and Cytochrome b561/ferric reductase transmembrane domain-containing protein [Strongyloides ratti]CEF62952.1 Cytochrome b561, eukaryote domain and Cytochrome b561/ferric reductase transmembrane domain-containing protein [Strongyloides ratti]